MNYIQEALPLPNFDENERITLIGCDGFRVSLMTYGATLLTIFTKNRAGESENVLCCFENYADFTTAGGYLNASVGPVAGRIAGASFTLDGAVYHTQANEHGVNTLHSGCGTTSKLLWQLASLESCADGAVATLTLDLPDGFGGFPGNRRCTAEFRVAQTSLSITYCTETDQQTPANFTNHAYFDLSARFDGRAGKHEIQIPSSRVVLNDAQNLPTEFLDVAQTAYDLRERIAIDRALSRAPLDERLSRQRGFDNAFDLAGSQDARIRLHDAHSGRTLNITTNQNAVVFYLGGFMDDLPALLGGIAPTQSSGVCLETQDIPNAQALGLPLQTAQPDAPCVQRTTYVFSVE